MTNEQLNKKILNKYGEKRYEILYCNNAHDKLELKCLDCGNIIYIKYLSNFFVKSRKNFCPYCAGTKKKLYKEGDEISRISFNEAQKRLDEVLFGEYQIIEDSYKKWTGDCLIRHTLCGKIFKQTPRELLYHSHCPCYTIASKGELKIKNVLDKYNISYQQQFRFGDMKKAPYGFFLPDYNLLIEFQGRQHFEPVKQFGGEKQFKNQQDIDYRKKENAKKYGYNIFYLTYLEMSSIEEKLVQRLSLTGVGSSDSKQ